MARFQGNIHQGSDRAAATLLLIILLVLIGLLAWWLVNPTGFTMFWTDLFNGTITR